MLDYFVISAHDTQEEAQAELAAILAAVEPAYEAAQTWDQEDRMTRGERPQTIGVKGATREAEPHSFDVTTVADLDALVAAIHSC
jgi:hypothetical protein